MYLGWSIILKQIVKENGSMNIKTVWLIFGPIQDWDILDQMGDGQILKNVIQNLFKVRNEKPGSFV